MALSSTALTALRAVFGRRLLVAERLARHTSARIGGPADAFLVARTLDDLRHAARIAWAHGIPLFILGGGSNILISDVGVHGLVVLNQAKAVTFDGPTAVAESGVSTIHLARRCARLGLTGFEWAIGVPGTLGGAAYGNAGAHGGDMSRCVTTVELVTRDGEFSLSAGELAYEYRSSILKRGHWKCVILTVALRLTPDDPAAVSARMKEYSDYRKRTQPPGATIGSMFKNPPGDAAGRLIEAAGLKGTRVGGAEISAIHANFFLNAGNATAQDVKALADLARREVERRFAVRLDLEIELVGSWSEANGAPV